jgi:predicted naringenin-chalcone synthase
MFEMNTTVGDFQIVRPLFELDQEESLKWIAAIHTRTSENREAILAKLLKIGQGVSKIKKRGASFGDFFHQRWDEMEIYPSSHFGKRSQLFDKIASEVFEQFYPEGAQLPPHLVHVTCTGYVAPSAAQKIASLRRADTLITHTYHMGCYAAIPALRIATGFPGSVDIVHTEICSLHLNPDLHEMEQLVVQTLFADGFIKYTLHNGDRPGFKVLHLAEMIIPDSTKTMRWVCEEWGLKMTLSKELPVKIARAIPSFVEKLKIASGILPGSEVFFAIHPGGPRIIEQVSTVLGLKEFQFEHSQAVLYNHGNMSSATVPHIWEKLWNDPAVHERAYVISLAFGPGLTLAGGVFQK